MFSSGLQYFLVISMDRNGLSTGDDDAPDRSVVVKPEHHATADLDSL